MPGVYFPACSKAMGMCLAAPDVCKVPAPPAPPIPTPFPNMAMCPTALNTVFTVLIENKDVIVEMSEIPSSNGDEPGALGGVVSSMIVGPATFKKGSFKVKAKGKPIATLTGITAQNGKNANAPAGFVTVPSQAKVLVAP